MRRIKTLSFHKNDVQPFADGIVTSISSGLIALIEYETDIVLALILLGKFN